MKLKSKSILGILLLGVVLLSFKSLTSFPWSNGFSDEANYASYGYNWKTTGIFASPQLYSPWPKYAEGDTWHSKLHVALFLLLNPPDDDFFYYGRLTSFLQGLLCLLLCFFIARSWNVNGFWLALLMATHERFLWASHAFRPEITLALCNSIFLILLGYQNSSIKSSYWFLRGLVNVLPMAAHGNGIVTVVLNCFYLLRDWIRTKKPVILVSFALGAILSLGIFYFWQIAPSGGWAVAKRQLSDFSYGAPRSFFQSIESDIKLRWYPEIFGLGKSKFAHTLRLLSYLTILGSWFWIPKRQLGRFMAPLAALGFTFLVGDKFGIHFAGILPFFLLPLLFSHPAAKWIVLLSNSLIFVHHISLPTDPLLPYRENAKKWSQVVKPDLTLGNSIDWYLFVGKPYCHTQLVTDSGPCSVTNKKILFIQGEGAIKPTQLNKCEILEENVEAKAVLLQCL